MSENDSTEPQVEYREVPDFPEYRAGTDGSVWSRKSGEWKRLKPGVRNNYKYVSLCKNSKAHTFMVHRVIALTFIGPRPNGLYVTHLNGNANDNRLVNLAYRTPSDNQSDRLAHGTDTCGAKNYSAKLTEEIVGSIRLEATMVKGNITYLANKYNVSPNTIANVVYMRTWKYVPLQGTRNDV